MRFPAQELCRLTVRPCTSSLLRCVESIGIQCRLCLHCAVALIDQSGMPCPQTHCFDKSLVATLVEDNINPIDKVEKTSLASQRHTELLFLTSPACIMIDRLEGRRIMPTLVWLSGDGCGNPWCRPSSACWGARTRPCSCVASGTMTSA